MISMASSSVQGGGMAVGVLASAASLLGLLKRGSSRSDVHVGDGGFVLDMWLETTFDESYPRSIGLMYVCMFVFFA
jgi:hypothetical protein